MMGHSLKKLGINVKFVDPDDFDAWESAVTDRTKLFFAECVGNPNANIADIEKLAEIAHRHGIPLFIDSTFTTPYLLKPAQWGADIVLHSATKFLGGHGTSMGGIAVDIGNFNWSNNPRFPDFNEPDPGYHGLIYAKEFGSAAFIVKMRVSTMRDYGACASPFNSFMILQGIETLSLRMKKHCENAFAIAQFLQSSEYVNNVNYPALEGDRYHNLYLKYLPLGCGGVFTFDLKGDRAAGARFIDNLHIFRNVANVGDVRSLVIHPATTTHSQLSDKQLFDSGIAPSTIRLSVGLEDKNDLINDIKQAMENI